MNGEMADVLWDANLKAEARKASNAKALEILEPVVDRDAVAYFQQQYAEFLLAPSNEHPNPAEALKFVRQADAAENHSNPETLETLAHAYTPRRAIRRERERRRRPHSILCRRAGMRT